MAKQLEDRGLYLHLKNTGVLGTFHWGITVMGEDGNSRLYHATNASSAWQLENWSDQHTRTNPHYVLFYRIGTVDDLDKTLDEFNRIIIQIPADGLPSRRTGEAFSSRTWAKDAIVKLNEEGFIQLPKSIDEVEADAYIAAYIKAFDNDGATIPQMGAQRLRGPVRNTRPEVIDELPDQGTRPEQEENLEEPFVYY